MRKILLSIVMSLLLITSANAAEGDTTVIQSHQETHWSWNGLYQDTVQFPTSGTYQKIRMHYVLGCPSGGCSQWDYKTNIELWDPLNDSTFEKYELARVITPYAGDKSNGWFHEYIFDVTDYSPLLTGEKVIMAYYGGYQDGFTITVWFDFIEGTPPRDVVNVQKIYRSGSGGFVYGYSSDPIESHLTTQSMSLDPATEQAKFRLVATGHGFGNDGGNPDNCAEFCPKWFKLRVNNVERYEATVWNDECGAEANVAQTGTWIYNRAGWCPGSEAQVWDYDLTSHISASTINLDVDWEPYTYTSGSSFPIHYWIESQLFEYGGFNYTKEAEITQILRPTDYDRQSKYNPTCAAPLIEIRNNGSETMTQVAIKYGVVGGTEFENQFTTNLEFGQTAQLELPIPPENFYKASSSSFYAEISQVNGSIDENESNNRVYSEFESVINLPDTFMVQFRTNNLPAENSYFLINTAGDTIIDRSSMAANTQYIDTLALEEGCYTLHVSDAGGDGLAWWANSAQGTGSLRLTNIQLGTSDPLFLENIDPDFGSFTIFRFTVNYNMEDGNDDYDISQWDVPNPVDTTNNDTSTVSVNELWLVDNVQINLFPNPTNKHINLELLGYKGNATVFIFDATGREIIQQEIYSDGYNPISLNLDGASMGIYHIKIDAGSKQLHSKFMKQ